MKLEQMSVVILLTRCFIKSKSCKKNTTMSELPWFRLYADAIDNVKLRMLAFEDRWHFVALCCCKRQGLLDKSDDPNFDRMLAIKLGVAELDLQEIKRRLMEVDLIDDQFQPVGWADRQFESDSSTARVRKYRAKQKKRSTKQECNVSVTGQDTDTDTDTDKTHTSADVVSLPAKQTTCPHQKIIDLYHAHCPDLPKVRIWEGERQNNLRQRFQKFDNLEWWEWFFKSIHQLDFYNGRVQGKSWRADLRWIVKHSNFQKLVDKAYERADAARG